MKFSEAYNGDNVEQIINDAEIGQGDLGELIELKLINGYTLNSQITANIHYLWVCEEQVREQEPLYSLVSGNTKSVLSDLGVFSFGSASGATGENFYEYKVSGATVAAGDFWKSIGSVVDGEVLKVLTSRMPNPELTQLLIEDVASREYHGEGLLKASP